MGKEQGNGGHSEKLAVEMVSKERKEGLGKWVGRTVVLPDHPETESWEIISVNFKTGLAKVAKVFDHSTGQAFKDGDREQEEVVLVDVINNNKYYNIVDDASVKPTIVGSIERGEVRKKGSIESIKGVVGGQIEALDKKNKIFGECKTIEEIKDKLKVFPGGNIKFKKAGEESDFKILGIIEQYISHEAVLPAKLIKILTNTEGFRDAIIKVIRLDFESDSSFASCSTLEDIIKRLNNIISYNKVFSTLPDFSIPPISLVNSGGESLFALLKEGLGKGEVASIFWLQDIKNQIAKGVKAEFVKTSESYKAITRKYGFKAAVDRALT